VTAGEHGVISELLTSSTARRAPVTSQAVSPVVLVSAALAAIVLCYATLALDGHVVDVLVEDEINLHNMAAFHGLLDVDRLLRAGWAVLFVIVPIVAALRASWRAPGADRPRRSGGDRRPADRRLADRPRSRTALRPHRRLRLEVHPGPRRQRDRGGGRRRPHRLRRLPRLAPRPRTLGLTAAGQ
jgi:hypothetical protein